MQPPGHFFLISGYGSATRREIQVWQASTTGQKFNATYFLTESAATSSSKLAVGASARITCGCGNTARASVTARWMDSPQP